MDSDPEQDSEMKKMSSPQSSMKNEVSRHSCILRTKIDPYLIEELPGYLHQYVLVYLHFTLMLRIENLATFNFSTKYIQE